MSLKNKRILKEAAGTLEVAIAKCLSQGRLHPSELEEILPVTIEELVSEHDLDHLLAEKVRVHVQTECQRHSHEGLAAWQPDSRKSYGSLTRTHPIPEGKRDAKSIINEALSDEDLEDITDLAMEIPPHTPEEPGKMLDYGSVKSDSHEGRTMRQALYEISEYSRSLHDMLADDDDVPQWCHYKVAVARACIGKVKHYLEYKIKKQSGEIQ